MKFNHSALLIISGLLWFVVGITLLSVGIQFLLNAKDPEFNPAIQLLGNFFGNEESSLLLLAFGLFLGYIKGKKVLAKAARKGIENVLSSPAPASLAVIFNLKYCVLIGLMICLGFVLKLFPTDIRGIIDVAVGSALINGSLVYLRKGLNLAFQPIVK